MNTTDTKEPVATATNTLGPLTVAMMHPRVKQTINGRVHSSIGREIRLVKEDGRTAAVLSHHDFALAQDMADLSRDRDNLRAALTNLIARWDSLLERNPRANISALTGEIEAARNLINSSK